MKTLLFAFCLLIGFASQIAGQTTVRGLPNGAVVLETRKLPTAGRRSRELVLWMLNPRKNPNGYKRDEPYMCPDQSRGSYYSGPTRVSLINSATNAVVNTVDVSKGYEDGEDRFDLPYAIRKGYYYRVEPMTRNGVESKPTILWLRDYNGDGRALEFALFDAVACMGLQTTLIGYSEKQDRVIQYPIKLDVIEGAKRSHKVSSWADYLFNKKPLRPGYWKYEIDYRGRAGSLDKWEVRYNPVKEQFEGKLISIAGD